VFAFSGLIFPDSGKGSVFSYWQGVMYKMPMQDQQYLLGVMLDKEWNKIDL